MKKIFEDSYIKFTENNIILLRNKFEYEQIPKPDIKHLIIKNGFQNKNWLLSLTIGLGTLLLCLKLLMNINFIDLFSTANSPLIISFRSFLTISISIIALFTLSLLLIISSLKKSKNIYITYISNKNKIKNKVISLTFFEKNNQLVDLVNFLKKENYLIPKS